MAQAFALLAFFLLALSLLNLLRATTVLLWKLSVLATEWGHLLALASVGTTGTLFALLFNSGPTPWCVAGILAAKISLVFFLRPVFEAWLLSKAMPGVLRRQFGETPRALQAWSLRELVLGNRGKNALRFTTGTVSHEGRSLAFEVHRPDDENTRCPAVVVVHGGGWDSGSPAELRPFNQRLAGLGFVVVAVDYSLAPQHRWPAQRDDVSAAIRHVVSKAAELGFDPGNLFLMGRSAGAHIALSVAYGSHGPNLRGVISLYGPADLLFAWHGTPEKDVLDSKKLMVQLLGGPADGQPSLYRDASPYFQVSEKAPPTLLIHGGNDPLVWKRQSARLHELLISHGVPSAYLEIPYATHAFDFNPSGPSAQLTLSAINHFVRARSC